MAGLWGQDQRHYENVLPAKMDPKLVWVGVSGGRPERAKYLSSVVQLWGSGFEDQGSGFAGCGVWGLEFGAWRLKIEVS